MRIFLRFMRVACFPAVAPVWCYRVVWGRVRAYFEFLPFPTCDYIFFWFVSKGSTPHLRAMILSGNSSYPKTWLVFPYLTEVVTQFLCHLLFQVDSLKDICEETLRKDIDNDTVLLCLGVAEQFSVSRLKVRTIDVPYCSYKLRSWSKVWLKKVSLFSFVCVPVGWDSLHRRKNGELWNSVRLDLLIHRQPNFVPSAFPWNLEGVQKLWDRGWLFPLPTSIDFPNACPR